MIEQNPISSLPPIEQEMTFYYLDDTFDATIKKIAHTVSQIYTDILGMNAEGIQQWKEKGASFYPVRTVVSEHERLLFKGTLEHKLTVVLGIKEPVSLLTDETPHGLLELTTKEVLWRHAPYLLFPCRTNTMITFHSEEKRVCLKMSFKDASKSV